MSKVKVAMIVGKMLGGGVEEIVLSYVNHIDTEHIHYTCIIDSDSNYVPMAELEASGADIVFVPSYKKIIAYQKALIKIFKSDHYDIVHSHINTLSIFPLFAAWRAGIPVRIAHSHSTSGKGEVVKNVIKNILRPFSKLFATDLCACGQYAGEWLFGKNSSFSILPSNIDFEAEKYLYNPETRKKIRNDMGMDSKIVLGHVGRIIPQKNHKFLVQVFSALHNKCPETVLILIGNGELKNSVRELTYTMGLGGSVIFLGQREDVEDLYQAMDFFILPSLYEGKPLSAMEAQLASLPVLLSDRITSETALVPELVSFESLDASPEQWADDIISILERMEERKTLSDSPIVYAENYVRPDELHLWYEKILNASTGKITEEIDGKLFSKRHNSGV